MAKTACIVEIADYCDVQGRVEVRKVLTRFLFHRLCRGSFEMCDCYQVTVKVPELEVPEKTAQVVPLQTDESTPTDYSAAFGAGVLACIVLTLVCLSLRKVSKETARRERAQRTKNTYQLWKAEGNITSERDFIWILLGILIWGLFWILISVLLK